MGFTLFGYDNIVDATVDFLGSWGVAAPSLVNLVRAGVWIGGLVFLVTAILKLRTYRLPGNEKALVNALWMMFFAILCINLDAALSTATQSVFGSAAGEMSPLSYPTNTGNGWSFERATFVARAIIIFLQFVGYISFARGILILNRYKTTHPTPNDVSFGKGMTHIIGGVILANLSLFATFI
jgi:hypothetical protein